MSAKPLVIAVVGVVFIGVCGWVAYRTAGSAPSPEVGSTGTAPAAGTRPAVSAAPATNSPPAVTTSAATSAASLPTTASDSPAPAGPSAPPAMRPDANPHVASVAEAVRTNTFPERRSPLIAPKAFDLPTFTANPQAYLDIVEPGRVFQTAAPGAGVPVLRPQAHASFMIAVGETCTLSVVTAPHAPVSFFTTDLGTFSNSLTAITVQADDQGLAKTTYAASGGVIGPVNILAGSPLASGQVQFHVIVTDPTPVAVSK